MDFRKPMVFLPYLFAMIQHKSMASSDDQNSKHTLLTRAVSRLQDVSALVPNDN
jgi:hypothetical protein